MIKDIRAVPVLRLLSGLVAGILSAGQVSVSLNILLSLLAFLIVSLGVLYFGRLIKKPGFDWCNGVVIISFYFLLGLLVQYSAFSENRSPNGNVIPQNHEVSFPNRIPNSQNHQVNFENSVATFPKHDANIPNTQADVLLQNVICRIPNAAVLLHSLHFQRTKCFCEIMNCKIG